MMLFSTEYKPEHYIFSLRPESLVKEILFYVIVSFFGVLSSSAGHELVHHKQWLLKAAGSIPYC